MLFGEVVPAQIAEYHAKRLVASEKASEYRLGKLCCEIRWNIHFSAEHAACALRDQVWHQPIIQLWAQFGTLADIEKHQWCMREQLLTDGCLFFEFPQGHCSI